MQSSHKFNLADVWISCSIAFLLWGVMFSKWTSPYIDFWDCMLRVCIVLSFWASIKGVKWWKEVVPISFSQIAIGTGLAILMWGIFWVGDKVSSFIFPFERAQVESIYSLKEGGNVLWIGLSLFFVIGPTEEIFWRSYVQRKLMFRYGRNAGFILATLIYTGIHLFSFNFMLIMSALVLGIVWGLFYRFFPQYLFALILSHALWDTLSFCVFPF
ncbi:MAG TPA: CPBP family intramembrane metalloprotease [Porphyromonadaceae bacterium]|nr:CPBP family intramembrane metalloprotease [Porphyromonadaceae bacterium]